MRPIRFDPATDGRNIRTERFQRSQDNRKAAKDRTVTIRNARRNKPARLGWSATPLRADRPGTA